MDDIRLPWSALHVSRELVGPGRGRLQEFMGGVKLLVKADATVVFAHTLKAGLAAAIARAFRKFSFVYVGHGVRYPQVEAGRPLHAFICRIAENFVYLRADAIWHLREIDLHDARRIAWVGISDKCWVIPPRVAG